MNISWNNSVKGAVLSLENASKLIRDADILFENQRYPTAYFLAQIAFEEISKVELLLVPHLGKDLEKLGLVSNKSKVDWQKILNSSFKSHKVKNSIASYYLPKSKKEASAKTIQQAIQAFNLHKKTFHKKTNLLKNTSLYVSFEKKKFYAPESRISKKQASGMIRDSCYYWKTQFRLLHANIRYHNDKRFRKKSILLLKEIFNMKTPSNLDEIKELEKTYRTLVKKIAKDS